MTRLLAALLVLLTVAACDSSLEPNKYLPTKGVELIVDSAVYHLQPTRFGYVVNLNVTVINDSDHDVYLWQDCGYWGVSRADGDHSRLELGAVECADASLYTKPAPLPIAAHSRYSQIFPLYGDLQTQARPQITLENNIGIIHFHYIFTDPSSTKLVALTSAPFEVLPP